MPVVRLVLFCALLGLLPGAAHSQPAASQAAWIDALRQGGHVIVFRHGATYSDQADTDPLNPANVAQQRQLNDEGRALAKRIGELIRKLGIPVGQVQTSIGVPPMAGSNVVIVSHKPNIMDAFGKDWFDVREGEASVFKPDGNGGYTLIVRVQANEWSKLAQTSN